MDKKYVTVNMPIELWKEIDSIQKMDPWIGDVSKDSFVRTAVIERLMLIKEYLRRRRDETNTS